MRSKLRKKYQRELNKKIRALNKNIENDNLWRGRFVFYQRDAHWYAFEDGSGGELIAFIRAYDKKTGYYHDYRLEFTPWRKTINWHIYMDIANAFIVEHLNVWKEVPRPDIKNAKDFTKVKIPIEKIMAGEWNFYISRKI